MIGKTNATTIIGGGTPTTGDYLVRYIDIDGTVLKEQYVNSGQNATPPTNPNYDSSYLTFSAWSKSSTNITNHKDIGALYTTVNNKSYAFVSLTTASGVAPTLYFNKSDGSTLTVDWGDSSQSTFTNTGNFNTGAHTYSTTGNYVISIWISSGSGTYSFGNGTNTTMFLGTYKYCLTKLYIGSNVITLTSYSFYEHWSLISISIPITVTTLNTYAFAYNYKLKALILNDNITSIPNYLVRYGYNLLNIVFPNSVSTIGGYSLQYCRAIKYIVLPSITNHTLGTYTLQYCNALETLRVDSTIYYFSSNAISDCVSIKELIFSNGFLGFQTVVNLSSLNMIDFPSTQNSIETIYTSSSLTKVICRATTPPSLVVGTFNNQISNKLFKIFVPDANVATYKAATNWSAYADYIYPLSDIE